MKKITAILLTTALIASLAGCNKAENESAENPTSTDGISTAMGDSTPESGDDSSTSEPESKLTEEQLKLVSELKHQSFTGPDGEEVLAQDADYVFDGSGDYIKDGSSGVKIYSGNECPVDENGNMIDSELEHVNTVLRYNFAYVRYCRPLFYAGEILDGSEREELINSVGDAEWFKVRAGDKLDCGLTVKKALYERIPTNYGEQTYDNYIEFDGEITLEGVLITADNPGDYLTKPGDLIFTPDPTKTSGLPASSFYFDGGYNIYYGGGSSPDSGIQYVMADVGRWGWTIGTTDDLDNRDAIFGRDQCAPVKVTLTNVKFCGDVNPYMPAMYAEIVDIERVD